MFKKSTRILAIGIAFLAIWQYLQHPKQRHKRPEEYPPKQQNTTEAHAPKRVQFGPHHPRDFNEAKSILRKIYPRGEELYCGCKYDLSREDRIDEASCGYKGKGARSKRIEWEHVVPASVFGQKFSEWTKGHPACQRQGHMEKGRNCARDQSESFRGMEADLYNLLPSLGELNGARSNYAFGEIGGEPRAFGGCDFEVVNKKVEPRPKIRGDIARIYFYMDARYPGFDIVNKSNEGMLTAWDRDDPIDAAERQRLRLVEETQGNSFYIGRLQRLAQVSP